jgi:hypothetical protein
VRIVDLKQGDHLEDSRRGTVFIVREITPCGSCPCGWGEISYEEVVPRSSSGHAHVGRRHRKTFKQFERLRFLRRAPSPRVDNLRTTEDWINESRVEKK